jgi:thioester reductase-like protein
MAMHVVTRLERAGYRIGYSALFSNPTPQLLAMKLDETEKGKEKPDELLPSKSLEENVSVAYETNWVRHLLGDVLLTGATGFLGSHVLKELLLRNGGRIYCLVRRSEKLTGWERLQEVMRFYFGTALDAHLRRIQVVEGDFLTASLPPTKTPLTVINCAALVKHFAAVEDLQKNNVEGPLRLADYCMKKGHRLVQISTLPIGVANAYVRSKMDAEERLLALTTKGLSLKIVRLGNLSPRFSDGALQQQYEKNVTMALLRTVALVGCYPHEAQNVMLDFTPVDEAAKALLLLAETPGNCDVYHLFNPQLLSMGELSSMLKFVGVIAEPVHQAIFEERISRLMQQSAMATKLTAALAWYKELPMPDITFRNHPDNQKTEALLSRCRYQWPVLTASYFQRFLPKM